MTTLSVSATGPYGVSVEPDKFGHAAVVKNWVRLPNGKFGQIQKHGGINLGDVLVAINDINITNTPHEETKEILSKSMPTKVLKFVSSAKYYSEKKSATTGKRNGTGKDSGHKAPFLSIVKRARVNNFASTKFAEYEIVCQLRLASQSVGKEKTFKWSVWKRFSDFEQLNTQLRKTLGWNMDTVPFPSSHTFTMSKLAPDFMEQRRDELNEFWLKVIAIDKVTEFNKHHCSSALKEFIDVDRALLGDKPSEETVSPEDSNVATKEASAEEDEDTAKKTNEGSAGPAGAGQQQTRRSRRLSTRAGSNKAVMRRGSSATSVTSKPSPSPEAAPPPPTPSTSSAEPSPVTKATAPAPAPAPSSSLSSKPPSSNPARSNLLGSINALRKD